jgi:hypothetical protein
LDNHAAVEGSSATASNPCPHGMRQRSNDGMQNSARVNLRVFVEAVWKVNCGVVVKAE